MARERRRHAVALPGANAPDLRAKRAGDLHRRPNRIAVGLKALQLEGDPVLTGVAVVDPQHIVVAVVRTHIPVSVAGVKVDLPIAVHIACGEAVHGVAVREHVGDVGEGLVSVVLEVGVRPSAVDQIHVPVVVKILELGLQKEPRHLESASGGDVREVARAVVLQQQQGRAVVGHQAIEIAVVVNVREVGRPALLKKHQAPLRRLLRVIALPVVDPKLVHPTRVLRVVHKLTALRDVEVNVPVPVKVGPHRAVVAAVVRVGVSAGVVARERHKRLVVGQRTSLVPLPKAAHCVVMTRKHVQHTVLVDVRHVAGLHEHRTVPQALQIPLTRRGDVHQVHPVVGPAAEHVFVAVVVKIAYAHPPLAGARDVAQIEIGERAIRRLVQGVQHATLVEDDQVIVAVPIQIRESHAPAAVVGRGQGAVAVGEGLGLGGQSASPAPDEGKHEGFQSRRIHGSGRWV